MLGTKSASCTPFAIHTDFHLRFLQEVQVLRAGEVTPPVTVPDHRGGHREYILTNIDNKRQLKRLIELPANHKPRIPIEDRDQVYPPFQQTDIGNVNAPDLIGSLNRQISQIPTETPVLCAASDSHSVRDRSPPYPFIAYVVAAFFG